MSKTRTTPEGKRPRSWKKLSPFLRIGLWGAIIVHVLGFLLFWTRSDHMTDRGPARPYVTYISNDSLAKDIELEEYATLFDSAPLFIPTRWNASQSFKVDFEDASAQQFPEFEPEIELFSKLQPEGLLIEDTHRVSEPSDLLASRFWRFFESFGKLDKTVAAFEPTAPVAEFSVLGQSRTPFISLPVDLDPTNSFSVIRPAIYTMGISNSGMVWNAPTLVETSGDEVFDKLMAQWLQRSDILAQLPDGYLSVRVFFW